MPVRSRLPPLAAHRFGPTMRPRRPWGHGGSDGRTPRIRPSPAIACGASDSPRTMRPCLLRQRVPTGGGAVTMGAGEKRPPPGGRASPPVHRRGTPVRLAAASLYTRWSLQRAGRRTRATRRCWQPIVRRQSDTILGRTPHGAAHITGNSRTIPATGRPLGRLRLLTNCVKSFWRKAFPPLTPVRAHCLVPVAPAAHNA